MSWYSLTEANPALNLSLLPGESETQAVALCLRPGHRCPLHPHLPSSASLGHSATRYLCLAVISHPHPCETELRGIQRGQEVIDVISFLLARATTSLGNSHNLDKGGGGSWLALGIPRFLMEAINPSFIPALCC